MRPYIRLMSTSRFEHKSCDGEFGLRGMSVLASESWRCCLPRDVAMFISRLTYEFPNPHTDVETQKVVTGSSGVRLGD